MDGGAVVSGWWLVVRGMLAGVILSNAKDPVTVLEAGH